MSGPAPFGMRWVDGALLQELSERDVLCELVEAFVTSGGRIKATAVTLNSKGHKTRRGTAWSDTAVARVIRNPALAEMIPGTLWLRCNGLLIDQTKGGSGRSRRPIHPLGAVVHCRCGGRMRLRGNDAAGKYVCRGCRAKIAHDTLEKLFANSLSSVEIDATEIVAALDGQPRAAELTRMLGGRSVPLSEVWPELELTRRRQLVDLLVAQLVVGHDDISVVFRENDESDPKHPLPPVNSLPTSHGSKAVNDGATSSDRRRIARDAPDLFSVGEVAEALRISRSKVYELIASRRLPAFRPGGRLRIPAKLVREFLRDSRLERNPVR